MRLAHGVPLSATSSQTGTGAEGAATVARFRDESPRLYPGGLVDNIDRLREADQRRSSSTPSTPDFHEATQDTEDIAADIWEQARRGDRDTPNGGGDNRTKAVRAPSAAALRD